MNAERAIVFAYLTMSVVSLIWQGLALVRLVGDSDLRSRATAAYSGLRRTSICRVGAAIAYVLVSANALWPKFEVLIFTFVVLSLIQGVWQLNAWADLRLARRLRSAPRPTSLKS